MSTGISSASSALGTQTVVIKANPRGFSNIQSYDDNGNIRTYPDIIAQAVIEEILEDNLEVSEHPIEAGAPISDNAYKRPSEVTLKLLWSNSPTASSSLLNASVLSSSSVNSSNTGANVNQVNAVYAQLRKMQAVRALFTLQTGKFRYLNMICRSLTSPTDYKTENALVIHMVCRQVLLVNTQVVALPGANAKNPSANASMINAGPKQLTGANSQ